MGHDCGHQPEPANGGAARMGKLQYTIDEQKHRYLLDYLKPTRARSLEHPAIPTGLTIGVTHRTSFALFVKVAIRLTHLTRLFEKNRTRSGATREALLMALLVIFTSLASPSRASVSIILLTEIPRDQANLIAKDVFGVNLNEDMKVQVGHEVIMKRFEIFRLLSLSHCHGEFCPLAIIDRADDNRIIKITATKKVTVQDQMLATGHAVLAIFDTPCGLLNVILRAEAPPAVAEVNSSRVLEQPFKEKPC